MSNKQPLDDRSQRIVWVDLEMTGLDITKDCILEMACIITDSELNIIEKGPELVIHRSNEVLESMNSWCIDHHGKSGLTDRVKNSKITIEEAQLEMFNFIEKHVGKEQAPLAGNSVYQDRKFLEKEMPLFNNHLHYRIIDVSSIKELARRWYPTELKKAPKKEGSHRALKDIEESIEELKFYRTAFFK
ncbi:hypothetical protein DICPUDRAFT_56059 [Dictyostelium purpureum]|uniref:Exonuclease domain-containing protein n=1 Tax=Dictyostelium purpureum TaxID=5786 RepID=F0ZPP2_DICPU|nr:uncharacterized protein DICPUDRAFT_56059 [Dictyostelium purpureum]EGC34087.1 hypothetical protein DICPUDRAFT_56059 [Dictyostelium purpureum]|eukprot:XP_003289380.1 hypothetical protein DICPUDRAFT_56059 [Dictyostelium purpureum]